MRWRRVALDHGWTGLSRALLPLVKLAILASLWTWPGLVNLPSRRRRSDLAFQVLPSAMVLGRAPERNPLPDSWTRVRGVARAAVTLPFIGEIGLFGEDTSKVPGNSSAMIDMFQECLLDIPEKKLQYVDIQLPPGFGLGLEVSLSPFGGPKEPSSREIARGSREIAAAFWVAMNNMKASRLVCFLFRSPNQAAAAKKSWREWGDSSFLAFPSKRAEETAFSSRDDVDSSVVDSIEKALKAGAEYVIAVEPRARQLRALAKLDLDATRSALDGKLNIVLVNAGLRGIGESEGIRKQFAARFDPVFHVRYIGDLVLFRSQPDGWVLFRPAPPGGTPDVFWRGERELTSEDLRAVLKEYGDD